MSTTSAYCSSCRALWVWLVPTPLYKCHCPACWARLREAWRAVRSGPGQDMPVYQVGSLDVLDRPSWRQLAHMGNN